jgi:hypothetical protein
VREAAGGVRAELCEKKGRSSGALHARTHNRNESKKIVAKHNSSLYERFMKTTILHKQGHRGPHPGALAIVYALLFNFGLYFVISFRAPEHLAASAAAVRPYFPGPWESAQTIAAYFQTHSHSVLMCAFLQFGAAIPLGIFTATMVSRLRFLGFRAAGADIALFGGLMTAFNIAISALVLWVMAYPGIADVNGVVRALYYIVFAVGGVGFSVPMGLLIAGISIPGLMMKLLPKWLVVSGLTLAAIGELSFFSLVIPSAVFLIPLTRFPSFVWLIFAGFKLPSRVGTPELTSDEIAGNTPAKGNA